MRLLNSLLSKLGIREEKVARDPIRVFLLDDDKRRHQWFSERFKEDFIDVADNVETAQEFCDTALEGEFESFDSRFHDCSPSLQECLEAYLERHQASFVSIT